MTNDEWRNRFALSFLVKIDRIPSFDIRYSIFDILRFAFPWFCGSLFNPGSVAEAASLVIKKPCHFGVFVVELWPHIKSQYSMTKNSLEYS
jgi:hypothetical protein